MPISLTWVTRGDLAVPSECLLELQKVILGCGEGTVTL